MAPTTRSKALTGSSSNPDESITPSNDSSFDPSKGPLLAPSVAMDLQEPVLETNNTTKDDSTDAETNNGSDDDMNDIDQGHVDSDYLRGQSIGEARLQSNLHIAASSSKGKEIDANVWKKNKSPTSASIRPMKKKLQSDCARSTIINLKNMEATCYAKAFEPLGQTTNMAGLGGFADLFSQLDDGNFSSEEREMLRKCISNYANENAAINNEYMVSVNNAEMKKNEETLKSTIRVMKVFATVCNNRAIRLEKTGRIPMVDANTSTSMPTTSTTMPSTPLDTDIKSMPSACADTLLRKSGAPEKRLFTKNQVRKQVGGERWILRNK
uniref:Uncharacterized protein n=1 Tax=Leersia perrieri TaxID=77586 RepID=A0A0D9XRN1_9ORYZ